MATPKQINYYKGLCEDLGQEPDEEFDNFSIAAASHVISEIIEMLKELEGTDIY